MSSEAMTAAGDVRFVVLVYPDQGRYQVDCFCEFPPPRPGFGAETETVHRGEAGSVLDVTGAAVELAGRHGFSPAEIVWSGPAGQRPAGGRVARMLRSRRGAAGVPGGIG